MKRISEDFNHFWSLHESAVYATLSASRCQQASSFYQIVGRSHGMRTISSRIPWDHAYFRWKSSSAVEKKELERLLQ